MLASKSPRRQELLRHAGVCFSALTAKVTEVDSGVFYQNIPLLNAMAKAHNIAEQVPDALVLGVDTVIEFNHQTIGKPLSQRHAATILEQLSGNTHQVVSAVCLKCKQLNLHTVFTDITAVQFKQLSTTVITEYLQNVDVLDKAGAYAIQEYGEMLVANINGSISNVIGLPIEKIMESISRLRLVL